MGKMYRAKDRDEGKRLDIWLCGLMKTHSRKQIKQLLDLGLVLVNGKRVIIAGWKIEEGDQVEVREAPKFEKSHFDEDEAKEAKSERPSRAACGDGGEKLKRVSLSLEKHLVKNKEPKKREPFNKSSGEDAALKRIKVHYADKDVIVVEKPAGLITVSEFPREGMDTLYMRVREFIMRKHASKGSFVVALHRLDAETSGIVAFALSNAGKKVEGQFKRHSIDREYTAIVDGRIDAQNGAISKPLEKGDFPAGKKVRVSPDGERAITEYRVVERYRNATQVRVRLKTGRTHQIRVHFAEEGHAVLGDKVYADANVRKRFHRHALHASLLAFDHPTSGKRMKFTSPLPKDMERLVDELRS